MDSVVLFIASLAAVLGTLFSIVGVLGYIRFPDVYTRLHSTGKVGVFGVVLLLIAVVVWEHISWGRGLILVFFLMLAGPATAHALASAANRIGLPMKGAERDDLVHSSKSKS
jgi:multicomponent Na+:H+ antiporter subunit G